MSSKQPKAPISEAMKEGEEPLRSFSDLLQFYESKRTEPSTPPAADTSGSNPESSAESHTDENNSGDANES